MGLLTFSVQYTHQSICLSVASVMFAMPNFDCVKRVVSLLPPVGVGVKYGLKPSRKLSLASPRQLFRQSNMTHRWQRREISNFDYLMFLNTIAGMYTWLTPAQAHLLRNKRCLSSMSAGVDAYQSEGVRYHGNRMTDTILSRDF